MKTAPGVGNIELTEIPTPIAGKGEVVIKVHTASVCGTDVHIERDRFANSPPFVLGHEFSGIIDQIGPEVDGLKPGTKVVSANNPFACGTCRVCQAGCPNLCTAKRAMGIHSDGCFAEYVKLPANLIHVVPDTVSLEDAALMEPLAVATHAVANRCRVHAGDSVVVFGPGAIGLLAAQVARAHRAARILVVGTGRDEQTRFKCAAELGLETANAQVEDIPALVMRMTDGQGADIVVEASGSTAAIDQGLSLLARTGRMAISGITGKSDVSINWDGLISKGVTLYFCYSSVGSDWQTGLQYLANGTVTTSPLITHRFQLDQWQEAFTVLRKLDAIRPVFEIASLGASNE